MLVMELADRQGEDLGFVKLKTPDKAGYGMSATPNGTILGRWSLQHSPPILFEMDLGGKVLWEYAFPEKMFIPDAQKLSNGNVLFAGSQYLQDQTLKNYVCEIDTKGKVLRRVELDITTSIASARDCGRDRLLISIAGKVFEIDWNGRKHFEYSDPDCVNAVPLENGNFVCLVKKGNAKTGRVVERTRDGKEVWSGSHGCPVSIQMFSNGNVLVVGGGGLPAVEFDRTGREVQEFKYKNKHEFILVLGKPK